MNVNCKKCKVLQENHKQISLEEKIAKEEEESLKSFLQKCEKKSDEAEKKRKELDYLTECVKETALKAIDQMTKQKEQMKEELEKAYTKEIESIKNLESKQLDTIQDEIEHLKIYTQNCYEMHDTGEKLLSQTMTFNFVNNSRNFLSNKQVGELPVIRSKTVKMIEYVEPLCKQYVDPDNPYA